MKCSITLFLAICFILSCQIPEGEYVCSPCDLPCDGLSFSEPGSCPHCKMKLIKKNQLMATMDLKVNDINIQDGSGQFLIAGRVDFEKTISVHYHKPNNFTTASNVIIVLPGAGRNGNDYRDAWIDASEKYGVLILSLEYSELHYPAFWNYNLAGMIYDVNIEDEIFKVNANSDKWIFDDFDRIFTLVQQELNLTTNTYDMFGHSAGGQILHRLAMFYPNNLANRIVASNSGWYTLATDEASFPYGLNNFNVAAADIDFSAHLTIFLGEEDNANETRGHLRHTPEADKQGLHRLERGRYFYDTSKIIAGQLEKEFNWTLQTVPDIGHDYSGMSNQAAEYLYDNNLNN